MARSRQTFRNRHEENTPRRALRRVVMAHECTTYRGYMTSELEFLKPYHLLLLDGLPDKQPFVYTNNSIMFPGRLVLAVSETILAVTLSNGSLIYQDKVNLMKKEGRGKEMRITGGWDRFLVIKGCLT